MIARMAILTLICDGYIAWANRAGAGEFFEQEYDFYLMCFKISLGNQFFAIFSYRAPLGGKGRLFRYFTRPAGSSALHCIKLLCNYILRFSNFSSRRISGHSANPMCHTKLSTGLQLWQALARPPPGIQ